MSPRPIVISPRRESRTYKVWNDDFHWDLELAECSVIQSYESLKGRTPGHPLLKFGTVEKRRRLIFFIEKYFRLNQEHLQEFRDRYGTRNMDSWHIPMQGYCLDLEEALKAE